MQIARERLERIIAKAKVNQPDLVLGVVAVWRGIAEAKLLPKEKILINQAFDEIVKNGGKEPDFLPF